MIPFRRSCLRMLPAFALILVFIGEAHAEKTGNGGETKYSRQFLFVAKKLHQALPQDQIRKAFGREEIQSAVTEARVNGETGAAELEHSVPLDSEGGFPAESARSRSKARPACC